MRLYEFESKELLKKYGVSCPNGAIVDASKPLKAPCVVKAQVLFNKRTEVGGVKLCKTDADANSALKSILHATLKGEKVERVLVEDLIDIKKSFYVGFVFDTDTRSPMLLVSAEGGTGIEEQKRIEKYVINPLVGLNAKDIEAKFSIPASLLTSLWDMFVKEDCKLLELNPLAETKDGWSCVDAHIELDDFAMGRHKERKYGERPSNLGRPLTSREKVVKAANDSDYAGTVKYVELDGNIAFLAAGGGGSLTCMDALIDAGGKPANYTEFSGNPSDEKMYVLTKEAITKPGIKGCWIVGAIANFSRVDTMMAGIVKAFEEVNPKFPIVVRRAGPYEKEGLALLKDAAKKHGWAVEVFGAETPLTATAKTIVEKVKKYGNTA